MAAPTYNCMFSAGGTVKTCTAVRGSNTNAGCPLYDATHEQCSFAETLLHKALVEGDTYKPSV